MKRLPSVSYLERTVSAKKTLGKHTVADSEAFLQRFGAELAKYSGIEHFAIASESAEALPNHNAIEKHLVSVRAEIVRELWSREVFLGVSVIDALLFDALVRGRQNPVRAVLTYIRDRGLHRTGMVVYPLHSFGLAGSGLFQWWTNTPMHLVLPNCGFAISPQTNSFSRTLNFLNQVNSALGVSKPISENLLRHWRRSRPTGWLESNPLLVAKVRNLPGEYFENQFLLTTKLRACTAFCCMLAALQDLPEGRIGALFSTRTTNNWQTLDIRHYIVWYGSAGKFLDGDCVPMNASPAILAELSDLSIDLSPSYWSRRRTRVEDVWEAVRFIQAEYLKRQVRHEENPRAQVARKLFFALRHFQRSFRAVRDPGEACSSLSTAFELLLVDQRVTGIRRLVAERARKLLRGVSRTRKYVAAIEAVYEARNSFMHAGLSDDAVDLPQAQRAFVHCFVRLTGRFKTSAPRADSLIGSLIDA